MMLCREKILAHIQSDKGLVILCTLCASMTNKNDSHPHTVAKEMVIGHRSLIKAFLQVHYMRFGGAF